MALCWKFTEFVSSSSERFSRQLSFLPSQKRKKQTWGAESNEDGGPPEERMGEICTRSSASVVCEAVWQTEN